MRIFTFIVFMLVLGPALLQNVSAQPAPEFSLQDTEGYTHSLDRYKGKVLVLAFAGYS